MYSMTEYFFANCGDNCLCVYMNNTSNKEFPGSFNLLPYNDKYLAYVIKYYFIHDS